MTTKKTTPNDLTYFEKQRDLLISEISISMDSILNNLNSLNRSLESNIQVGKEFKSVSNLWSNFYDGLNQIEELRIRSQSADEEEDRNQVASAEIQQQQQQQGEETHKSNDEDMIQENEESNKDDDVDMDKS